MRPCRQAERQQPETDLYELKWMNNGETWVPTYRRRVVVGLAEAGAPIFQLVSSCSLRLLIEQCTLWQEILLLL
jgi:hypothetical protein